MLYFTAPWLFCNYLSGLLNLFTFFPHPSPPLPCPSGNPQSALFSPSSSSLSPSLSLGFKSFYKQIITMDFWCQKSKRVLCTSFIDSVLESQCEARSSLLVFKEWHSGHWTCPFNSYLGQRLQISRWKESRSNSGTRFHAVDCAWITSGILTTHLGSLCCSTLFHFLSSVAQS